MRNLLCAELALAIAVPALSNVDNLQRSSDKALAIYNSSGTHGPENRAW